MKDAVKLCGVVVESDKRLDHLTGRPSVKVRPVLVSESRLAVSFGKFGWVLWGLSFFLPQRGLATPPVVIEGCGNPVTLESMFASRDEFATRARGLGFLMRSVQAL